MASRESKAIFNVSAAHGVMHSLELAYPAVMPAIAMEFSQGAFALGTISTLYTFTFGVMAILAGWLADRVGSQRMVALSVIGSSLIALVMLGANNLTVVAVTLIALGIAPGLFHPAAFSFISRNVANYRLGMAYLGVGGNIGQAAAPLLAATIASLSNWRYSFAVLAIPALAFGLFTWFNRLPEQKQSRPAPAGHPPTLRPASSTLALAAVYTAGVTANFSYWGFMTFLPTYLRENVGIVVGTVDSIALAGSFATLALLVGAVGQYVGGYLCARFHAETLALVFAVTVAPVLIMVGLSSGLVLVAMASLFSFLIFAWQPISGVLVADHTPARWHGFSYGIYFFFAYAVAGLAGAFSGAVAESHSLRWAFVVLSGSFVPLFASLLYLWLVRRRIEALRAALSASSAT